jgi:hypothetical protein
MARPWTNTFIQETRFAQFPRGVTLENYSGHVPAFMMPLLLNEHDLNAR